MVSTVLLYKNTSAVQGRIKTLRGRLIPQQRHDTQVNLIYKKKWMELKALVIAGDTSLKCTITPRVA